MPNKHDIRLCVGHVPAPPSLWSSSSNTLLQPELPPTQASSSSSSQQPMPLASRLLARPTDARDVESRAGSYASQLGSRPSSAMVSKIDFQVNQRQAGRAVDMRAERRGVAAGLGPGFPQPTTRIVYQLCVDISYSAAGELISIENSKYAPRPLAQ